MGCVNYQSATTFVLISGIILIWYGILEISVTASLWTYLNI